MQEGCKSLVSTGWQTAMRARSERGISLRSSRRTASGSQRAICVRSADATAAAGELGVIAQLDVGDDLAVEAGWLPGRDRLGWHVP